MGPGASSDLGADGPGWRGAGGKRLLLTTLTFPVAAGLSCVPQSWVPGRTRPPCLLPPGLRLGPAPPSSGTQARCFGGGMRSCWHVATGSL